MVTGAATNTAERKGVGGETSAADRAGSISQVVSFRLANEEYGLNIMQVQEIILMGDITEIPEVPAYIRGLINLRGKVIPIVDLRQRFGLDRATSTEQTRIIVVNAADKTFGIVVDAVSEVLRIDAEQIEPPPTGLLGVEQAYLKGLVKMNEKIMILLNIDAMLTRDDERAIAGAQAPATAASEAATACA